MKFFTSILLATVGTESSTSFDNSMITSSTIVTESTIGTNSIESTTSPIVIPLSTNDSENEDTTFIIVMSLTGVTFLLIILIIILIAFNVRKHRKNLLKKKMNESKSEISQTKRYKLN